MFGTTGIGEEAGTMRSDPGDLFAAASASSRRAEDDGGDLFGSKPPTGSRQAVSAAGAGAAAAADAKLRGERNENSVLFSLNNLAQLASDKPAPITAPPSAMGQATGAAGGEGSGLIDIRSMANAYLGGPGAAKPATSSAIGSIDDLPVFGGGGFSEPAVIVPTSRPAGNNKMMFGLIGAVGLLAVAAVILVVVMLGKKDKEPPAAVASADTDKDKDKDKPIDKATDPKPDTNPAGDSKGTDPKPDSKGTDPKPDSKGTDSGPKTPATNGGTAAKPPTTGAAKPPTTGGTVSRVDPKPKTDPKPPDPKPDASGGTCDEVSCVLNNYEGACCQKFRKGGKPSSGGTTTTPKPSGDLPDKLDRAMISEGVAKVKARVMGCGDKSSAKGQVKVSVKVSSDGAITAVSVQASPDQALGNCVAAAMQRATFRKTANGGSFIYPFVF
jgi:hypothetical protein